MGKKDLRVIKTKRSIHDAMIKLIFSKDLSAITVTEVANQALVNRKTFYAHYSKVEDVLDEIEEIFLEDLGELLGRYDFFKRDFDCNDFINAMNDFLLKNFEFYQRIVKVDRYRNFFDKGKDLLKDQLIKTYPSENEQEDFHISLTCEYVASGLMSIYYESLKEDLILDVEKFSAATSEILKQVLISLPSKVKK